MKLINILIAIISGTFVLTYIFTGLDFMSKARLISVTNSVMFIVLLLSLYGVYSSFKRS